MGLSSAALTYAPMEDVRAILARNIKAARKRLNLSQEELAARAQIDRTYVSGIERRVRNPTITEFDTNFVIMPRPSIPRAS